MLRKEVTEQSLATQRELYDLTRQRQAVGLTTELDVANAGAKWEDSEVVVDQGVITSRNPGDLEAFSAKIIEEVKEGRHTQRSAA